MVELTNAIKAALYERAKKPFTGTFALAWIIINWRIWLTLLFVDEVNLGGITKTKFISDNYINYWDNLWIPLLVTVGLIFIIPILNLGALFVKKIFDDIEFTKILKKTPADGTQVANLLEKIRSQKENFTLQIVDLNNSVSSIKTEIIGRNKEINILEKQINTTKKEKINIIKQSENNQTILKKTEVEYLETVDIVNNYKRVIVALGKEFGPSSNKETKRIISQLDSINLRRSRRLKDIIK